MLLCYKYGHRLGQESACVRTVCFRLLLINGSSLGKSVVSCLETAEIWLQSLFKVLNPISLWMQAVLEGSCSEVLQQRLQGQAAIGAAALNADGSCWEILKNDALGRWKKTACNCVSISPSILRTEVQWNDLYIPGFKLVGLGLFFPGLSRFLHCSSLSVSVPQRLSKQSQLLPQSC